MSEPEHQPSQESAFGGGLIQWFSQNHVAANILMLLFLVGGVISVISMRTETFPSIDPRLITITVPYPGATPYEVADGITNRIEEQLIGIDGVERIASTASEGVGVVRVELEDFANADDVYNDVETEVNSLTDFPPEQAERPLIKKVKITPLVMTIALHGEVSELTLKYWAETLQDEIRQLSDVARTSLRGIRDYQISIEVDENKLRNYGMSLAEVSRAVNQFAEDIPAGTIESSRGDILLRVQEQKYTGDAFEEVVLRTLPDGSKLYLKDVATIHDAFTDSNLVSRFNNERAAFIDVLRSETDDTLQVAQSVVDYLDEVELPANLHITLQEDKTVALRERIALMMQNAVIGFMLVFLILLLFLDLKLAFWTSVAIPVSFLGGMMFMHAMGYSVNMISLFALIVVLGVVVDDAIVTGESIFDMQERRPNDPTAVMQGVMMVIAPVSVGIFTTIFAFAPLIFSTGTLGQIISIIPVVVISVLLVSLIEAFLILPSHLSRNTRWSSGFLSRLRNSVSNTLHHIIDRMISPAAAFCIRWRYATLAAFFLVLVVTVQMVRNDIVRFVFFPQIEGDEVSVTATLPQGTPFAITQNTMREIEQAAIAVREEIETDGKKAYQSMLLTIGQTSSDSSPRRNASQNNQSNVGQLVIQLVSSDQRARSSSEIEAMIRKRIKNLPNVESLEFQSSPIGDEPDIKVELTHPYESQLNAAAETLKRKLEQIEGTTEVADSFEPGKTEFVFEMTNEGLAVGLTPVELGQQLRSAFFGLEAQRFQRGRSEVIVYVRYPKADRETLETLERTRIRLADGSEVPLSTVAGIKEQTGYSQIQSVDGMRIVSVTSDVDLSVTTPNSVMEVMRSTVLPELKEQYPGLNYSFEGESRDQREDLQSLFTNLQIALLLIFVLLGAQLRSYIQPLIIMSAIPFGIVGAIWGHYLLGYDLTFISMFGMVALTGVVVNDSVVLMDYLNRQLREGKKATESALLAIERRFRPILLTTLTTSLGLMPILLETSLQAQFLIPMVVSLAMGIVFATGIILLLVPCLVVISEDVKYLGQRFLQKLS